MRPYPDASSIEEHVLESVTRPRIRSELFHVLCAHIHSIQLTASRVGCHVPPVLAERPTEDASESEKSAEEGVSSGAGAAIAPSGRRGDRATRQSSGSHPRQRPHPLILRTASLAHLPNTRNHVGFATDCLGDPTVSEVPMSGCKGEFCIGARIVYTLLTII